MNDIIQDGHPTLREVAKEVPLPASEEDKKILHSLLEYVKNSQDPEIAAKYGLRSGIGLARQFGARHRRCSLLTRPN